MFEFYYRLLAALHADRRGVTAVEYAVIAGVLVTVIAVAFKALGTGISTTLDAVVAAM